MDNIVKRYDVELDVDAIRDDPYESGTTFFSLDRRTAKMTVKLIGRKGAINLTDAVVFFGFDFVSIRAKKVFSSLDGKVVIEDAEDGVCSIIMPSDIYAHHGTVLIHVYVKYENGDKVDAGVIETRFEKSWLDQNIPEMQQFYVKRIEDVIADALAQIDGIDLDVLTAFKASVETRLDEMEKRISGASNGFFVVISEEQPVITDGNYPLWLRPITT